MKVLLTLILGILSLSCNLENLEIASKDVCGIKDPVHILDFENVTFKIYEEENKYFLFLNENSINERNKIKYNEKLPDFFPKIYSSYLVCSSNKLINGAKYELSGYSPMEKELFNENLKNNVENDGLSSFTPPSVILTKVKLLE